MGRIVIPRPRLRSGGPGRQVGLQRPRQRQQPRRSLTLKEKYGVSEYELIRLGLDAAIGLGGRAEASSETARRREQRGAAQQERTGAQEASQLAATEALAELEPGKHVGGADAFFASQEAAPSVMGGQSLSIGSLGAPAEGGQSRLRPGAILALDPRLAPEDLTDARQQQMLRQQGIALADAMERGEMDALPAAGGSGEMAGLAAVERAEAAGALDIHARPGDVGGYETLMNRAAERAVRDAEQRLEGLSRVAAPGPGWPMPGVPQTQLTYQQGQRAAPGTGQTAVGATLASDMALDPAQTARQRAEIEAQYQAAQPSPQQQRASYIPTTLGEAQAMARFATTQEEMAVAMEHIDQLARAGGLEDAITGAHIRRAQEAALKGWRPPQGETALDRAKLENITQRTETSRMSAEYTRKRMEAFQDKLDKGVAKSAKVSKGLRRTGDDSGAAAQDELRGWSKDFTDKVNRTGDYESGSDGFVAFWLSEAPHGTEDEAVDLLFQKRSGRFANEDNKTIAGAVYRTWPDGTGSRRTNRRNKGLRSSGDAMTSSAINLAKKRAEAGISVGTTEAKEDIKNSAREAILKFKATLPTTGERTGAASRRGRINEKLASVRAALTAASRPDDRVYYEEYIRNLEGLLTQSAGPAGIPTYVPGTVSQPTQLESSGR